MRLHYLQHVPFEGLGLIADWARERGHIVTATRLFEDGAASLPAFSEFDLLVVLGGPMSVHDTEEYPWLSPEMAFITRAINSGKACLGICLGAQIFATVLGAKVGRSKEREIGWFPIHLTETGVENPLGPLWELPLVFHWHSEGFALPDDAERLATSPGCVNQAFCLGGATHVLALQFHLESTEECVRGLLAHATEDELAAGPFIQPSKTMLADAAANSAILQPAFFEILDNWSAPRK